ncbi:MBL fold metallo-hydrolase [Zunongwangia sp. F363]|uniref:beta-lactamase n=1 Tax=Autumnicola tepida TaxID=3075595 RepID=A0ABU3CDG1_9FLAO|nr:MBL fold metallo-hydrolase [Zunongwangia sp. F363]MDT0644323.1 MBL fold metallo-hydrolase [Zunongwangia sp. F363]
MRENIFMLTGQGGNIGILTGEDGVFMIDDQFAALTPKIKATLDSLTGQPVKFLLNTHFHGDHTGGNANFKKSGAVLVAQENVRQRLKENSENPAEDKLPVITFSEEISLHLNGNDIMALHVHNAHTDGDALIYLPQGNVLHTGDTFFNGGFPYIDITSGGSVAGDIEAAKQGLAIINENTKIIPGHGAPASYEDYQNYLEMLEGIRKNMLQAMAEGFTKEQIIEDESLTSDYYPDAEVENAFINGPKIRATFYESLMAENNE